MSYAPAVVVKRELSAGLDSSEYAVERLAAHHRAADRGLHFLVHWAPGLQAPPSWEPEENLHTRQRGQLNDYLRRLRQADEANKKLTEPCAVCLEDLGADGEGAQLVILVCGHAFCAACIDDWKTRQNNCPTCRRNIATGGHGTRELTVGELRRPAAWAAARARGDMQEL